MKPQHRFYLPLRFMFEAVSCKASYCTRVRAEGEGGESRLSQASCSLVKNYKFSMDMKRTEQAVAASGVCLVESLSGFGLLSQIADSRCTS